jgi:putative ABC transport system ATP-binding protein
MRNPSDWAIETTELTKIYGSGQAAVRAVDGVSIAVERARLVLIMGPSGSGKTTLLSMLGGLLRPTSGQILVDGVDITMLKESQLPALRAQRIGFIFQAFNLLSSLTAEENILFPASLVPKTGDARQRSKELMERLRLEHRTTHTPRDLSGGEKQRVAIARALINNPEIILADEPTGNLDSKSSHEVMMILYDLVKDEGRTVVVVTHNPVLEEMADKVLWIEDGRVRDRKDESHEWVQDPVCGMRLDKWTATFFVPYEGEKYYVCSQRCAERLEAEPQTYIAKVGT